MKKLDCNILLFFAPQMSVKDVDMSSIRKANMIDTDHSSFLVQC